MFWVYFDIIKKLSLSLLRRVTQYMLINSERFWEFQIEFSCKTRLVSTNGFQFWESPGMGYPMICQTLSLPHWLQSYSDFQMIFFSRVSNFYYKFLFAVSTLLFYGCDLVPTLWLGCILEFKWFQVYFCNFKLSFLPNHDSFSKSRTDGFQFGEPPVVSLVAELKSFLRNLKKKFALI